MDLKIIQELVDAVGAEHVSTERADLITHSYDATQARHLPDIHTIAPYALQTQFKSPLLGDTSWTALTQWVYHFKIISLYPLRA